MFGAVRSPQRVQMQRKARLLELLAFSGGVTEQAGGDIQIFHTEPIMCPEREAAQFEEKFAAVIPVVNGLVGSARIHGPVWSAKLD